MHRIDQPAYDWPLSTMKRFAIFLTQEKALEQLDYLFFFNANLTCREVITPEEFLPRPQQGEQLLLVQQPGFWNKKPMFYSYDRNPRCTAYIPYNCGRDYVSGGLNGGTSAAFLAMCKELDRRTEQDIRNGVVPLWHDESQLNRYAAEHPGSYRLLTPAYWYPEGWQMPFEQKSLCAINPATLMWRRSNTILSTPAAGCNANGKPFAKTTCRICCAQGTNCCKNTCNLISN